MHFKSHLYLGGFYLIQKGAVREKGISYKLLMKTMVTLPGLTHHGVCA